MIRWEFHLIRQAAQVHVPERRPEALCNSVLTPALSQPRSGEAPQAASGAVAPLVPHNSCSQCGLSVCLSFFSFQSAEAHVSWNAASHLPFLLPQPENSKCRLKTTIRQLCQHGRLLLENFFSPLPLNGSRQGAHANTHVLSDTNPPNHHKHSQWILVLHNPLQHLSYLHATRVATPLAI